MYPTGFAVYIALGLFMPLKHDISHMVMLKSAIEELFGTATWYELKETTSLAVWRKHLLKVLQAIRVAFRETVKVRDEHLAFLVEGNLARGEQAVKASTDLETLLSTFSATLMQQVFIQLGTAPRRRPGAKITLEKKYWQLDGYRSVQYIQSTEQLDAQFWAEQQTAIGIGRQSSLHAQYIQSKSKLSYAKWCREQEA